MQVLVVDGMKARQVVRGPLADGQVVDGAEAVKGGWGADGLDDDRVFLPADGDGRVG